MFVLGKKILRVTIFLGLSFVIGCGSVKRGIMVSSSETGSVISLVPFDNPESAGEKLTNPANFTSDKLNNRAIKIVAPGKAPEYWFVPGGNPKRLDIKVRQMAACTGANNEANKNRPIRFLLKGYQALSSEDYNLALEMAKQAESLDATLAAPHIISGLALLRQGKKEEARVSFNKAKTLDPEDRDIVDLLQMTQ
jgi:tetratricopeptide (TPR) repeat protein